MLNPAGVHLGARPAVFLPTCCVCPRVLGCLSLAHAHLHLLPLCVRVATRCGRQGAGWGAPASLLYSGEGLGFKEIMFRQE